MTDDAVPTADAAALESRLAAVERALTGGETDVDGLADADAAALAARVEDLEAAIEALDDRAAELEAATRALRGYVGGARTVNRSVERRADAALAAVESLERDLRDGTDPALDAADGVGGADRRAETADARGETPAPGGDGGGDAGRRPIEDGGGIGGSGDGGDDRSRAAALAARLRDTS